MIANLQNNGQAAVAYVHLDGVAIQHVTFADDFNGKITRLKLVEGREVSEDLTGRVEIGMHKDWCYDYFKREFLPLKAA